VGEPKLLLADEPTGALDSASGQQIMDLFKQLHDNGATIIMITHDRNVAEHAQTIMHIYDGILTEGESHE
jgi:putative ABC transport system ATP-binding protein